MLDGGVHREKCAPRSLGKNNESATWEIDHACPGVDRYADTSLAVGPGGGVHIRATEVHGVERPRPLLG
jgi:hypothetical protein